MENDIKDLKNLMYEVLFYCFHVISDKIFKFFQERDLKPQQPSANTEWCQMASLGHNELTKSFKSYRQVSNISRTLVGN